MNGFVVFLVIMSVISIAVCVMNSKESDRDRDARILEHHRKLAKGQDPWRT